MSSGGAKLARTDAPAAADERRGADDTYGTALVHAMRRLTVVDMPHDDEQLGGLRAVVRRRWLCAPDGPASSDGDVVETTEGRFRRRGR